jgi:hypothetical protein
MLQIVDIPSAQSAMTSISAHFRFQRYPVCSLMPSVWTSPGRQDDIVTVAARFAFPIGQPAVVQDLQQRVEDLGMRLLDLIEQDHAVGAAGRPLGELAALVMPDIACGLPKRRETVCPSMYSDISRQISASSLPNTAALSGPQGEAGMMGICRGGGVSAT